MNQNGRERTAFLFLIDYEMKRPIIRQLDELDLDEIQFEIKDSLIQMERCRHMQGIDFHNELKIKKSPVSFGEYQKAFDFVKSQTLLGNSFLANLTLETEIQSSWSLEQVFCFARAKYKLNYKGRFVCFSPETFVQIDSKGKISTFPMKGTIEMDGLGAYNEIINDPKELYEHTTIVDLLRNDLSRIADKVWVERFRFVEEIHRQGHSPLLQVSSEICGRLAENWQGHIGDFLNEILPAGSITGAPKPKTMEVIAQAEKAIYNLGERGYYTGIFGVFDGHNLSSSVLIRFIENRSGKLYFKSGGGITSRSSAKREYQEVLSKIYVPLF